MAQLGGYKNKASANSVFCAAKKKLLGDVNLPPAGAESATPKKKLKSVRTDTPVEAEGGEDDDDDEEEVPVKDPTTVTKKKATPRKRKVEGEETVGSQDAVFAETPLKKKRATRKKIAEVKEVAEQDHGNDEIAVKSDIKAEADEDTAADQLMEGIRKAAATESSAGGVEDGTEQVGRENDSGPIVLV